MRKYLLACLLCTCFPCMAGDFTIVLLPDIQNLTQYNGFLLTAMMNAIVANKDTCTAPFCPTSGQWNIQAVMGLGDNTNSTDSGQMTAAQTAWNILKNAGLVVLVPMGNHEFDGASPAGRLTTVFDSFFGPSFYAGKSWYGGGFPEGSSANLYELATIEGYPLLLMGLEFYPRCTATGIFATVCAGSTTTVDTASWAESILTANAARQAIVESHGYVTPLNGSVHRVLNTDTYGPNDYSLGGANWLNGAELYSTLVQNNNIVVMAGGHFIGGAYHGHISPQGTNALWHPVAEIFSDAQDDVNNNYITLLKFRPSLSKIEVYNYIQSAGAFDHNFPMYTLDWTPPTVSGGLFPLPSPRKH